MGAYRSKCDGSGLSLSCSGTLSSSYRLTFTGFTNSDCTCTGLNTSFDVADGDDSVVGQVRYETNISPNVLNCSMTVLEQIRLIFDCSGADTRIRVFYRYDYDGAEPYIVEWRKTVSGLVGTSVNESLSFFSLQNPVNYDPCGSEAPTTVQVVSL